MNGKPWSKDEVEFLIENHSTHSFIELSNILSKSRSSVSQKAISLGLRRSRNKSWSKEEKELLREHYRTCDLNWLAAKLGRSIDAIILHAGILGIQRTITNQYHIYNHHYFDKPTIENCYFAGFIAADGCLLDNNTVSIGICIDDIAILQNFVQYTNYTTANIGVKKAKNKTSRKQCYLSYHSAKQFILKLNEHWNLTPRKSLTLEPPKDYITGDLALAYIIGIFDGDGSWHISNNGKYKVSNFMFVGTPMLLSWIKNQLSPLIENFDRKLTKMKHCRNTYALSWRGKKAIALRERLKLLPIPFRMKRKWDDNFYQRREDIKI